jgi:hypothetical protein
VQKLTNAAQNTAIALFPLGKAGSNAERLGAALADRPISSMTTSRP